MRRFKVSEEMFPWLQNIFERDNVNYSVESVNEQKYVLVDLSGMKYREKMEDAMCEREMTVRFGLGPDQVFRSDCRSTGIPVYSARTLRNREKKTRLMRYYGHNTYQILSKDQDKVMTEYLQ